MRTGHLGPVILGMSPVDAMRVLGDPDDTSRKTNPLLMRYGCVQLSFWKAPKQPTHQLREIVIAFQPEFTYLPGELEFTDWNPAEPPTEQEFRSFIERIEYPPSHVVEGVKEKAFFFLSGVSALVSDGKLHSIRLQQKETRATPQAPVADEREPTLEQIQAMVFEAEHVAMVGANRAAMLIGWAALEATLRRLAQQEGRQGKVGVQPHILLRDLFASGRLNPEEHRTLEVLRQKRMAAAHGLAPAEMDAELVPKLIEITYRLLEAVHEGELTAASDSSTPPSP